MGEGQGWLFEATFNRAIKLRQADPWITCDAGALLLREADHRLGLTADLDTQLTDHGNPDRIRYLQVELLRQHLYALALGYPHQDEQDALAHDVAMKLSVWDRPGRQGLNERLASQPSDWRLIDRLASKPNRRAWRGVLGEWVARHQRAAGARSCTGRSTSIRSRSRCMAGRKAGPITATTANASLSGPWWPWGRGGGVGRHPSRASSVGLRTPVFILKAPAPARYATRSKLVNNPGSRLELGDVSDLVHCVRSWLHARRAVGGAALTSGHVRSSSC